MTIDAHLHLWDPHRFDYPWFAGDPRLDRSFLPADRAADAPDVDAVVLVEAAAAPGQGLQEVRWLEEQAAATGLPVLAVVAFAPVEDRLRLGPWLDALAERPLVAGVRRILMGEPPDRFTDPDLLRGLHDVAARGLRFDLAVLWQELDLAARLAHAVPELPMVLDHLGKPPVAAGWGSDEAAAWAASLKRLAEAGNVVAKLTGLLTELPKGAPVQVVLPFLHHALAVFGPARCMVGSDWPPSTAEPAPQDAASWFALVLDGTGLGAQERLLVGSRTAIEFYSGRSASEGPSPASPQTRA